MKLYIQVPDASPTPAPFVPALQSDAPVSSWMLGSYDDDYLADDTPSPIGGDTSDSIADTPSPIGGEVSDSIGDTPSPIRGQTSDSIADTPSPIGGEVSGSIAEDDDDAPDTSTGGVVLDDDSVQPEDVFPASGAMSSGMVAYREELVGLVVISVVSTASLFIATAL